MAKPSRAAAPPRKSSLRSRLNDATRQVIVDALVEQLADTGAFDFSMFELARRADVSARTIYRHFPTRSALFEALSARVREAIGPQETPRTLDDVVELVRRLFPRFDAQASLVIAELEAQKSRELPSEGRRSRAGSLQKAVAESAPRASEPARRYCTAALACLVSPDAWARLKQDLHLDGRESAEAVAWAIDAFARKLEADRRKPRRR